MGEQKGGIFGIILFFIILCALVPVVITLTSSTNDDYFCEDATYPIQSEDLLLCTNASFACLNPDYTIYNVTTMLCTNASGVKVANESPSPGFLAYNESASYHGASLPERTLLGLVALVLIIGGVLVVITQAGLLKKG